MRAINQALATLLLAAVVASAVAFAYNKCLDLRFRLEAIRADEVKAAWESAVRKCYADNPESTWPVPPPGSAGAGVYGDPRYWSEDPCPVLLKDWKP